LSAQSLFYLDESYDNQISYLCAWLESSDFRRDDLAKLGSNLSSIKKAGLSSEVAKRVSNGEIAASQVIDSLIDMPRTWGTHC
jgi:hypothetical protein